MPADPDETPTIPPVDLRDLRDRPDLQAVILLERVSVAIAGGVAEDRAIRKALRPVLDKAVEADEARIRALVADEKAAKAREDFWAGLRDWVRGGWGAPALSIAVVILALILATLAGLDPSALTVQAGSVRVGNCPTPEGRPSPAPPASSGGGILAPALTPL